MVEVEKLRIVKFYVHSSFVYEGYNSFVLEKFHSLVTSHVCLSFFFVLTLLL